MNEGNLKPSEYKLSQEEAKRGGVNSGKSRRQTADLRKAVQAVLDGAFYVSDEQLTGAETIAKKLFSLALEKDGKQNIAAIKLIIELTSQSGNALIDKKTKAEIKLLEAKLNAITGENEKFNEDEIPKLWKALGEVNSDESKS